MYPVESFEVGDLLCTSWVNVGVRSVIVLCCYIHFGVVVCWCELACIYTTSSYVGSDHVMYAYVFMHCHNSYHPYQPYNHTTIPYQPNSRVYANAILNHASLLNPYLS